MNSSFCAHQQGHLNGDNAPHPIDLHWRTPAALLLLALRSPQRRRPWRAQSSQRLACFALSKCARAHLEPQRLALPAHPIAAHSGASNCGFQDDSGRVTPTQESQGCAAKSRHARSNPKRYDFHANTVQRVPEVHASGLVGQSTRFGSNPCGGVVLRAIRCVAKPGRASARPWVLRLAAPRKTSAAHGAS